MTEERQGSGGGGKAIIAALAVLVLLAWLAWQFGLFGTGQEEGPSGYEADVTDRSGGEL